MENSVSEKWTRAAFSLTRPALVKFLLLALCLVPAVAQTVKIPEVSKWERVCVLNNLLPPLVIYLTTLFHAAVKAQHRWLRRF